MSRREFLSKQQSNQQATLNSSVEGTEQSVTESKEASTPIKASHVLILGGLTAFGPLSTDMYLPSLPTVSHDLGATMSQTQLTLSATLAGDVGPCSSELLSSRSRLCSVSPLLRLPHSPSCVLCKGSLEQPVSCSHSLLPAISMLASPWLVASLC